MPVIEYSQCSSSAPAGRRCLTPARRRERGQEPPQNRFARPTTTHAAPDPFPGGESEKWDIQNIRSNGVVRRVMFVGRAIELGQGIRGDILNVPFVAAFGTPRRRRYRQPAKCLQGLSCCSAGCQPAFSLGLPLTSCAAPHALGHCGEFCRFLHNNYVGSNKTAQDSALRHTGDLWCRADVVQLLLLDYP